MLLIGLSSGITWIEHLKTLTISLSTFPNVSSLQKWACRYLHAHVLGVSWLGFFLERCIYYPLRFHWCSYSMLYTLCTGLSCYNSEVSFHRSLKDTRLAADISKRVKVVLLLRVHGFWLQAPYHHCLNGTTTLTARHGPVFWSTGLDRHQFWNQVRWRLRRTLSNLWSQCSWPTTTEPVAHTLSVESGADGTAYMNPIW